MLLVEAVLIMAFQSLSLFLSLHTTIDILIASIDVSAIRSHTNAEHFLRGNDQLINCAINHV